MRILFNPIVRNNYSAISATNASINYNPANIVHPFLKKRYQATANSGVITITFTADQSANCLFYGAHNLSAITVVYKNSGGSTIGTVIVSDINDIGREYFTQLDTIRSIEITLSTASTYLKLGGFDCGVYYQMPDVLNNWPNNIIDNSITGETLGGQMLTDDIEKRKAYAFEHIEIEKLQSDEIITNYNLNGKRPIYVDIFEGNRNVLTPVYARIEEPMSQKKENRRYKMTTILREAS